MTIRVGTRGSTLARTQTDQTIALLAKAAPGEQFEAVVIATDDQAPDQDKARFVRGIELALLDDRVDIAVHSAKDLPGDDTPGLTVAAVPQRANPFDALCGVGTINELPDRARVGTSSLRRRAQLLAQRGDLEVVELRGNVDTRLQRLSDGDWGAIVLARAGLDRLGHGSEVGTDLSAFVPAPGQGCLAIQTRADDQTSAAIAGSINDSAAATALKAERIVMRELGATCNSPIGAFAEIGPELQLRVFVGLPDGSEWIEDRVSGPIGDPVALGELAAERVRTAGAGDLLVRCEEWAVS